MKTASIEGTFPEIRGNCYADGHGTGSTTKAAIARAVADMLKQPNVRGKKIKTIRMTVYIHTKEGQPSEPNS